MPQTKIMNDQILFLSIILGLEDVYLLISSFHDDDGEKYIYNPMCNYRKVVDNFIKQ